eukprot:jgi/Bigna1/130909/aug1.12_g5617
MDEKYAEIRRKYDVDPHNGFIPDKCLERLPGYFSPWEDIASQLARLNRTKTLVKAVKSLPLLDASQLKTPAELRRAYVILALIGHSYLQDPMWTTSSSTEKKQGRRGREGRNKRGNSNRGREDFA